MKYLIIKTIPVLFLICLLVACSLDNEPEFFEVNACNDTAEIILVTEVPAFSDGTFKKNNAADYPEMAQRAEIEGSVLVEFEINFEGIAENGIVKKGIGGGSDESSLNAVYKYSYEAAILDGEPVCTIAYATFIFDLDQIENVVMELDY